jgi:hypothetical protein
MDMRLQVERILVTLDDDGLSNEFDVDWQAVIGPIRVMNETTIEVLVITPVEQVQTCGDEECPCGNEVELLPDLGAQDKFRGLGDG